MIPIAAINAAVYGRKHRHNEISEELDNKYYKDMNKINENSTLILKYLRDTFKTEEVIISEYRFDFVIFELYFYDINIGIQIDSNYLLNDNIEFLQRYAYDLVYRELIKKMEKNYIKKVGN